LRETADSLEAAFHRHAGSDQCFRPGKAAGRLAAGWGGGQDAALLRWLPVNWQLGLSAAGLEGRKVREPWLCEKLGSGGAARQPSCFGSPSACQPHQRTARVSRGMPGGVPHNVGS